ncbi:MAG TPA: non-ribosomal peptide synthetase [Rhizomicrobium sp.]|jgi:amino acid adenylation domain-containing protein
MICAAACARPDAVALSCEGASLTYRELVAATDSLAAELAETGVARDVPVGICLERSFEHVIAMLAACRAGGAFLPLDPRWPEERQRFVLDDSRAPVVVTSAARSAVLARAGRKAITANAYTRVAHEREWAQSAANDLAYIIYTSGSTGEPKGVEITHRNLLNLIHWHCGCFGVTEQDRASCVAGLGFDAAVWEIWPNLCAGASIVLADDASRTSAAALQRFLVEEQITVAFVPTPLAEPLISAAWPPGTKLRFLLTGGDTLHARPVAGLPFAVINNYGPTECTVVATSGVVVPLEGGVLPGIGHPIPGVQIHILNASDQAAAPGETGEICIGGTSVARGYRNRPELTAQKFIKSRLAADGKESRLYRTGDLGCWSPDGQIEFHGRRDNQIKLRGHRIELDEISAALDRHPLVVQSAALASGEGSDMQLVAYVVLGRPALVGADALREFLAIRLPDYMLPSAFVAIPSLPVTPSGKIDVTALPLPHDGNRLPEAAYREPKSEVESRIAAIVAELLKLNRVGSEDNFFLLGGHSLLGTQLVLRARDAFGIDLTLRDLFRAQTVAKLSATIERRLIESIEQMSDEEAGAQLAS